MYILFFLKGLHCKTMLPPNSFSLGSAISGLHRLPDGLDAHLVTMSENSREERARKAVIFFVDSNFSCLWTNHTQIYMHHVADYKHIVIMGSGWNSEVVWGVSVLRSREDNPKLGSWRTCQIRLFARVKISSPCRSLHPSKHNKWLLASTRIQQNWILEFLEYTVTVLFPRTSSSSHPPKILKEAKRLGPWKTIWSQWNKVSVLETPARKRGTS